MKLADYGLSIVPHAVTRPSVRNEPTLLSTCSKNLDKMQAGEYHVCFQSNKLFFIRLSYRMKSKSSGVRYTGLSSIVQKPDLNNALWYVETKILPSYWTLNIPSKQKYRLKDEFDIFVSSVKKYFKAV